jgi:kinesin family protein 1
VNKAFVNEDATARIIRELKEEIEKMKSSGGGGGGGTAGMSAEEKEKFEAELAENQRLLSEAGGVSSSPFAEPDCHLKALS